MAQSRTALVLGATGGIGGEVARNLKAARLDGAGAAAATRRRSPGAMASTGGAATR